MGKAYKKGDIDKCIKAQDNEFNRKTYCQANVVEEYDKFKTCTSGENFCKFCCDIEFGELNINERDTCYKAVCSQDTQHVEMNGRWIWTEAPSE